MKVNVENESLPLVSLELAVIVFESEEEFKDIGVAAWQVAMRYGQKQELVLFGVRMPILPVGTKVDLGVSPCIVSHWSSVIVPKESVAVYCRLSPTGRIVVDCSRKAYLLLSREDLNRLKDTGWMEVIGGGDDREGEVPDIGL